MDGEMDLAAARQELARTAAGPGGLRAARQVLLQRGAVALRLDAAAIPGVAELVRHAAQAQASPARRAFAILLVDALALPDLLAVRSSRARLESDIRSLLETALPDVLLRAGYPFGGDADAKRRSLARLAASIDEHLRPLEPSIPTWLSGRANA